MFERSKARHEAAKFARSVRLGHTYYSVETHAGLFGDHKLLHEWVFTTRSWVTGDPMCGSVSAAGAWLRNGPLYETRPGGYQTLDEYTNSEVAGPDTGKTAAKQPKRRATAGAR